MDRRELLRMGLAAASCLGAPAVHGQGRFPERPLRLVVPFPPGGPYDAVGRIYAQKLGDLLGQPVVVENKGGGDTAIGAGDVAQSRPDGYSLLYGGSSTHVTTPAFMDKPPYDPLKSFSQLAISGIQPLCIAVTKDLPVKDLTELVAYARANPAKLNYAYPASTIKISGELFKRQAGGLEIVGVPYKGAAPALQDLLGGRVQLYPGLSGSLARYHREGLLRILAVMNKARMKMLPDVPTTAEAGMPELVLASFNLFCTTAGAPPPILDLLVSATHRVLNDPAVIAAQELQGIEPVTDSTPADVVRMVTTEASRLGPLIRDIRDKS